MVSPLLERWQKERMLEQIVISALAGDQTVLIQIRDLMRELGLSDLREFSVPMETLRAWQSVWKKT